MERQDLIDAYRKYAALLSREEANCRRLQRRFAAQVMTDVMAGKSPARRRMYPDAIRLAAETVKETRDCLACIADCLVGTDETRGPHMHSGFRYIAGSLGTRVSDPSQPIAWVCRNPHCTA